MNEPGIDLTGKLIIKVALGDDIRRILITNEDITYDELVLMMQRVYSGKLNSSDDIVIKYKDEDNDLITIFDSSDLNFAIQCSRILKITLFVNGKPEPLQSDEVKMIKGELKHIRNRCNELLDKLDSREPTSSVSTTVDSTTARLPPPKASESPRVSPRPGFAPPTSQAKSKEFDPLSSQKSVEEAQNKVMSSFGITNDDRAGTPDSVSSIGSAAGRKQLPQGRATPQQQGGQAAQEGTPSGKVPPWQNQQPVAPSPYSQEPQGYVSTSHPQTGYPPQGQTAQPGQSQPNTTQYGAGYQQQGQPHQAHPGPPGPGPQQQQGYQQPGYGMMSTQQHQQMPAQQQVHQAQAQQAPYPTGFPSQQQAGSGAAPGAAPGQGPPAAGNPYARQGPGYSAGYPRPAGNYPQGYQ